MMDLHADSKLLRHYDALGIGGHSEYWSAEMRANVEGVSKCGGHLIILSGNTMLWQIRIEGDKIVCYRYAAADPLLTSSPDKVTGRWFEWPLSNPENSVT